MITPTRVQSEDHVEVAVLPDQERVVRIPHGKIRRFANQPRKYFDPEELRELADSIEEIGLLQPILVKTVADDPNYEYELVDGERRWLACGLAKVWHVRAIITQPKSETDQFLRSVVSNFGRVNHTPLETARAVKIIHDSEDLQDVPPGERVRRIARMCARSIPWVYQHLALLRLDPSVLAMMEPTIPKERRLDFSIALYMTRFQPEVQVRIADTVVEWGLNVKEARALIREVAVETGEKPGHTDRVRRPHEDYRIMDGLLATFLKQIANFQQLSVDGLKVLFKRRSNTDLEQILHYIDRIIERLRDLRAKVVQCGSSSQDSVASA